jgi:glycogen phosphorylase
VVDFGAPPGSGGHPGDTMEETTSIVGEREPLGRDAGSLERDFDRYLTYTLGRDRFSRNAFYDHGALVLAIRDRLMERWSAGRRERHERDCRRVYYLSMEYLLGRALGNALLNLDIEEPVREVLARAGDRLETLAEQEHDAGLGNGGLGRLAACFLDSCATLAAAGDGLRHPLRVRHVPPEHRRRPPGRGAGPLAARRHPWEIERPEYTQKVRFGGRTETTSTAGGSCACAGSTPTTCWAVPYDVPIPGYRNGTVNTLRLWKATGHRRVQPRRVQRRRLRRRGRGQEPGREHLHGALPNDASENGKELRLRQQYFLASRQSPGRAARWTGTTATTSDFAAKNCFQLNDTHPTIAVAELMRLLMDEHGLDWDQAWEITTHHHGLHQPHPAARGAGALAGAAVRRLLPRHLEIIYEINARFLAEVARAGPATERLRRMSIIEEGPRRRCAWPTWPSSAASRSTAWPPAHRAADPGLFRDFARALARALQQQDQRRHPAALAAGCNPGWRG